MMTGAIEEIGQRIRRFLEEALAQRKPDRDIPASESIVHDLVNQLTLIGADDESWRSSLREVVRPSVQVLANRPEHWNSAAKLASIYLSSEWRDNHPRADKTVSRGRQEVPGQVHPVKIDIARHLMEQLFTVAGTQQRIFFLGSLDDWSTLFSFQSLIPYLDFTREELAAFLIHIQEFGKNDGALGGILIACGEWAQNHPREAEGFIRAWLASTEPVRKVSSRFMERLIAGAVASSPDDSFRSWVLSQLDGMPTKDAWNLAVFVECHAWPLSQYSDVDKRHAALVRRVSKMPEVLISTGLLALTNDAPYFPHNVLHTAVKLFELLPTTMATNELNKLAFMLVDLAARVTIVGKSIPLSSQPFERILNYAKSIPISWNLWPLDALLSNLVNEWPDLVRQFLASWLEAAVNAIVEDHRSLEEMFSQVEHKHSELLLQWLLTWMVSPSETLRFVATTLFGRRRSAEIPSDAVKGISELRLRALVHILASSTSLSGTTWIPILLRLALIRTTLLDEIRTVLLEEAVVQFPRVLLDNLRIWAQPTFENAAKTISEVLNRNRTNSELKRNVSELSIHPAFAIWHQRQNEAMEEAMRQAYARSVTAKIATQIPIARGEGNSWSGDPDARVSFSRFEFSGDFPTLDLIDPLEARMRRAKQHDLVRHLVEAAEAEDNARTT